MTPVVCIAGGLGVTAVAEDQRPRRVPDWVTAAGAAAALLSKAGTFAVWCAPAIVPEDWANPPGGGS
ncbi:MAG: hypothetical protein NTW28_24810 [Candidatus Solibacter sp.]|nr:hypothetical protein [Candidatus Solibacter sp.]